MMDWHVYLNGLCAMSVFALSGWVLSVMKKNVTLVDSMWSLFFLLGVIIYSAESTVISHRNLLLIAIVLIWSLRLSLYLTWRNWGHNEDHRYQTIRNKYEPYFWLKSLFIIFVFQALLAWLISLPLFAATQSSGQLNLLDIVGISFWAIGFAWESIADYQLAKFKSNSVNKDKVMNTGLWRLSRHPNYFGECTLWWGYYLIAAASGAWWSLPAPLIMTYLLLKFSGVALLEKDIVHRKPAYEEYIKSTNAFLPKFSLMFKSQPHEK